MGNSVCVKERETLKQRASLGDVRSFALNTNVSSVAHHLTVLGFLCVCVCVSIFKPESIWWHVSLTLTALCPSLRRKLIDYK